MKPIRPYTPQDRRVRVLLGLHRSGMSLTLSEVITVAGEERTDKNKSIHVRMLKYLRDTNLIDYVPAMPGQSRRIGGTYLINEAGRAWLVEHGFLTSEADEEEEEIVTGAMHSECRTVIESRAYSGQAPAGAIASVFQLGRAIAAEAA